MLSSSSQQASTKKRDLITLAASPSQLSVAAIPLSCLWQKPFFSKLWWWVLSLSLFWLPLPSINKVMGAINAIKECGEWVSSSHGCGAMTWIHFFRTTYFFIAAREALLSGTIQEFISFIHSNHARHSDRFWWKGKIEIKKKLCKDVEVKTLPCNDNCWSYHFVSF